MSPKANPYADFEIETSIGIIDVIQSEAAGLALSRPAIIINPKQTAYEMLDTFIHEPLHLLFPDWTEEQVDKTSRDLSKILWSAGYRRTRRNR